MTIDHTTLSKTDYIRAQLALGALTRAEIEHAVRTLYGPHTHRNMAALFSRASATPEKLRHKKKGGFRRKHKPCSHCQGTGIEPGQVSP